jgi:hypothetical protein
MLDCLLGKGLRLFAGALQPQNGNQCRFALGFVFAHAFAGFGAGAFFIEQIIRNLEGQTHIMRIALQARTHLLRRFSHDAACLAGNREQLAGF